MKDLRDFLLILMVLLIMSVLLSLVIINASRSYDDSVICYDNQGNVLFSEENVRVMGNSVHYEDGGKVGIPDDGCFVTYGD